MTIWVGTVVQWIPNLIKIAGSECADTLSKERTATTVARHMRMVNIERSLNKSRGHSMFILLTGHGYLQIHLHRLSIKDSHIYSLLTIANRTLTTF